MTTEDAPRAFENALNEAVVHDREATVFGTGGIEGAETVRVEAFHGPVIKRQGFLVKEDGRCG